MGNHCRRTLLLALAVAVALVAAACAGDSSDDADEADSTEEEATATTAEDSSDDDTDEDADTDDDTEAEDDEGGTTLPGFDGVTETIEQFVEAEGINGAGLIVVDEDAGVLYEEYFGEFGPDRISMIASTSKMISAGVLLHLQDDGLLDIDAPVEDVVDWTGNPEITTAQLLSNSSGLVGLGPDLFYSPYVCQWSAPDNLQRCGEAVFTTETDDRDQIPPDTEFRYGGAQWQVAGAVAEAVSGQSWEELINEIYVEPCGVDSLGYISLGAIEFGPSGYPTAFGGDPANATPSANPSVEGGAYITVGDYGELLLMHLRGGTCGDTQVLSQDALDTMHADRVAAVYDGDATEADIGYGMGWWIDRDTGQISDPGAWGAVSWLDLDERYGAYLIVEDEGDTGQALKDEIQDLVHEGATGA